MFPNQVTSRELCHNNPVKHFLGSRFEVTDSAFNSNQSGSQALSLSQLEFSQLPNSQELFSQAQHSSSGQGQDSPGRKFYQKYVSQGPLFNKQQSVNCGRPSANFVRDLDITELRKITKEKEERDLLTTLLHSVKECYTKTSEVLGVLKDVSHKEEQQSLNHNKECLAEIKNSVSAVCEDLLSALRCKDKESVEHEELVKQLVKNEQSQQKIEKEVCELKQQLEVTAVELKQQQEEIITTLKEICTRLEEITTTKLDTLQKEQTALLVKMKDDIIEQTGSAITCHLQKQGEIGISIQSAIEQTSNNTEKLFQVIQKRLSEEKQAQKTYFHDQQDILQQFLEHISNKALHKETDTILKTHLDEMKALLLNYFNSSRFSNRPTSGRVTIIGSDSERSLAGDVQVSDNVKSAMCGDRPKVTNYRTIEEGSTKSSDYNRLEVNQDMVINSDYRTLTTDDERNKSSHYNRFEADQDSILSYKSGNIAEDKGRSTDSGYSRSMVNVSRVIDSEYKGRAININSIIGFECRRPSVDWESIICPDYSRPPANMDNIIGHDYSPQATHRSYSRTQADRNNIQVDNRNRTTYSDRSEAAGEERIIGSGIRQTDENRRQVVYEDTVVGSGRRKTADSDRVIEFERRQVIDEDKFLDSDRRYAPDWHCMRRPDSATSFHTPRILQDHSVQQTISLISPLSHQNSKKLWTNPSPVATVLPYPRVPNYNPTPSHSKDVNNLTKVTTPKSASNEKHPMNIQDEGIHTRTRRKLAQENDNDKHSIKQNRKRGRKTIGQIIKNIKMSDNETFKIKRAMSAEKPQKLLSHVFGKEISISPKSKFTSPPSITEKTTISPGSKYKIFRSRNHKTVLNRSAQHFDPLKASLNCGNNRCEALHNSLVISRKTPNGTIRTPTMLDTSCFKDFLCQLQSHTDSSRDNESHISVNSEVTKQPSCDSSPCLSIKDIPILFIKSEKYAPLENEANSSPEEISDSSSIQEIWM
ncbi:uncharacterized protein LOC111085083 isoform X2 [Limulus polyphemus]|uniref:Uncharacterized protein LOC111085083 isoform X2 n=1 Tax=Limulus polyphemus TaxID=6850 RepID=A0ABM1S2R1_LIMPO|nr:uncharacterized protein LOC111085083 isoform X2 [Limulus polyphemus]